MLQAIEDSRSNDGRRRRKEKYTATNTNLKLPERFLEKTPRCSNEIHVASMFIIFGAQAVSAPDYGTCGAMISFD